MRESIAEQLNAININKQQVYMVLKHLGLDLNESVEVSPIVLERGLELIMTGDLDIVCDARFANGKLENENFIPFWKKAYKIVYEDLAVSDERRKFGSLYTSPLFSFEMLRQKASENLKPEQIPSVSTIRRMFSPVNPFSKTACKYKNIFKVKFLIQKRTMRKFHKDAHYGNSILKMAKEFAVDVKKELKDTDLKVQYLSIDDKHLIPVGPPDSRVGIDVRQKKKAIVPEHMVKNFSCLDHDMMLKGKIVPSGVLDCEIPDDALQSFKSVQVYMRLHDLALDPSTSASHFAELGLAVEKSEKIKLALSIIKHDGGPDLRMNFPSVIVYKVAFFVWSGSDILLDLQTVSGQSYLNEIENIFSFFLLFSMAP